MIIQFHLNLRQLKNRRTVPYAGIGRCLGSKGNGVSTEEKGDGGPGPPDKKQDKQSSPSEEGGNMEQEEEGRKSQA